MVDSMKKQEMTSNLNEEQQEKIATDIEKDIGVSHRQMDEILQQMDEKKKLKVKRIKWLKRNKLNLVSIFSVLGCSSIFFYIAITENNNFYIIFGASLLGLVALDVYELLFKKKKKPFANPVKYCIQITNDHDAIQKQECFPTTGECEAWADAVSKGNMWQIIDTSTGKTIKKQEGAAK